MPNLLSTLWSSLFSRDDHATTAIDWCETNYTVNPSIAEFYNTLSSFAFCLVGLSISIQSYLARFPLHRPLTWTGPLIFFLGASSALYHATLQLEWQRLDEASENIAVVSLLHGAFYPPLSFMGFACHSLLAALGVYRIHQFLFTELHLICSALALGFFLRILGKKTNPRARLLIQKRVQVVCFAAVGGALAWLVDRLACAHLPPRLNPQLHAWWHILGALTLHEAFAAAAFAGSYETTALSIHAAGLVAVVVVERPVSKLKK